MALMTAAEARVYLRGLTGPAEDTTLDTLIGRVGAALAAFCRFPASATADASIESATYTQYLTGDDPRVLFAPVRPVVSITSIHDSPNHTYATADLVASGDYTLLKADEGLVELDYDAAHGGWSTGRDNIKLVYVAGFATVPESFKHACGLQIAHVWKNRDTLGLTSLSIEGVNYAIRTLGLLPSARETVAIHRLTGGVIG